MHTTWKLRVPRNVPHRVDGSLDGSWLLGCFNDMAAELLMGIDGDEGGLQQVRQMELTEPLYAGDVVELTAEVIFWSADTRRIGFVARRVAGSLNPATPASSAACRLPHSKVVCSAKADYGVPPERRRIQESIAPLIIFAAPVGYHTTREESPYLPLTTEEIAADVARCSQEGATVVHLHVRDAAGAPTLSREVFEDAVRRIRARCDILIQVSTEGDASMDVMTRCQPLGAGADLACFATGTVNRGDHIYFNSKPLVEHVALLVRQAGLQPVFEICDLGFVENVKLLAKKGLVTLPTHFQLVLGAKGGMGARRDVVDLLSETIPRGSTWSVAGVGRHQIPMSELAIRRGGHVRVGLADNVYLERKELSHGSAPLVARAAAYARSIGRPLADIQTARKLLGLG
ncbi:MAG: 3-keto-5-aminohexanoate cleavage protein [Polyangia bacterium]|jgi:3-keto-5-aminohexanoate cleavage enzyme|nr:3-keto-5-aminohexanoate cleavage protein [Polyangia bacterium]